MPHSPNHIAVPLDGLPGYARLTRGFVAAVRSTEQAGQPMRVGDPQPYIDRWSPTDDCTLFGAWGPIERGIDRLTETFRWVGSRFTGGEVESIYANVWESGDVGVTIGFERGQTSVEDADSATMIIRVTHVYIRRDAVWALVHRHADFPPYDERS